MVMEQFNIQIENPCVILMQDTSRAFLNASKPAEKYKFFLNATQLEQISEDYKLIDAEVNETVHNRGLLLMLAYSLISFSSKWRNKR